MDWDITPEARERGTCSQCGKPFEERACGPTHALVAHRLQQEQAADSSEED